MANKPQETRQDERTEDRPRRVIKRYSNRKLYDTKDSRYVTLLQIAEMVRGGEEVQIIDNGPGLHPDVADRLFEAFATTKRDGMGLGLTVAADIIARHDGRIEVESQPGRTAFKILLPIDPDETT